MDWTWGSSTPVDPSHLPTNTPAQREPPLGDGWYWDGNSWEECFLFCCPTSVTYISWSALNKSGRTRADLQKSVGGCWRQVGSTRAKWKRSENEFGLRFKPEHGAGGTRTTYRRRKPACVGAENVHKAGCNLTWAQAHTGEIRPVEVIQTGGKHPWLQPCNSAGCPPAGAPAVASSMLFPGRDFQFTACRSAATLFGSCSHISTSIVKETKLLSASWVEISFIIIIFIYTSNTWFMF